MQYFDVSYTTIVIRARARADDHPSPDTMGRNY